MQDATEWRDIIGYEGLYTISNTGVVKTVARVHTFISRGTVVHRKVSEKIKSPLVINSGYETVSLSRDSKESRHLIHRLVAEAFNGPCPPTLVVNHKDGCKRNNLNTNLEYITYSENTKHAYATGLKKQGEQVSKLTNAMIVKMFDLKSQGMFPAEIGRTLGVRPGNVRHILRGETWKRTIKELGLIPVTIDMRCGNKGGRRKPCQTQ